MAATLLAVVVITASANKKQPQPLRVIGLVLLGSVAAVEAGLAVKLVRESS